MQKDAFGENGTRSAFCLYYVNQTNYDELMKLDFEYEVPDDPLDEPNKYSQLVRVDLREKVFEENVKLLDDIETDKVAK